MFNLKSRNQISISEARKSSFDYSLSTSTVSPLLDPPNFFLTERKTGTKFSCQISDDEKKTDDKNFFCSGNNLSQGDGECIPQN